MNQILEQVLIGHTNDILMIKNNYCDIFFILFGPCIEGFKYYKSLISVDETYLYEQYNEKLLIAVTFDANNKIFPLAFAIVNEKNNDNWR